MKTVASLTDDFLQGRRTPSQHLERVLDAVRSAASRTPAHAAFRQLDEVRAREAARAASERYANGTPLGPLDGVPVGVKDEVDMEGLPTLSGTTWMPRLPCAKDATVVARLRAAGAVLVGKTVQHELGIGATGISPHETRTPRNPHDPARAPGGSSSGSAVAVALGLVPLAIGTDAGGSIRIPASLCGVWGLKPTYGRIPITGDTNLGGTVGHVGPIARCVNDLALFVQTTAGADGADAFASGVPPFEHARLDALYSRGARGLRVGVDEREWADASDDVRERCRDALRALERDGAKVVHVSVPMARHAQALGYLTMIGEAGALHGGDWEHHRHAMAWDVRLALALGRRFRASEFVHAQVLRQRLRRELAAALTAVDLWATPTTAITAPPVRAAAEVTGEADQPTINALVRYTFIGNLTGLPAGTAPVATDPAGLPIGLQLIGRAWDELSVLRGLHALERAVARTPPPPRVGYEV